MVRHCSVCHHYVTGSPTSELSHGDVQPEPGCNLLHHPSPCPWVSRNGVPCTHHHTIAPPPSSLPPLPGSPAASLPSTTISQAMGGAPQGDLTLLQQIEQLRREKEEETRRADQLAVANTNLRDGQQRLNQEFHQQLGFPPSSISSTATTTTSTFSSLSRRPLMGTGFSSTFGSTTSSPAVSAGGTLASSVGSAVGGLPVRSMAAAAYTLPGEFSAPECASQHPWLPHHAGAALQCRAQCCHPASTAEPSAAYTSSCCVPFCPWRQ